MLLVLEYVKELDSPCTCNLKKPMCEAIPSLPCLHLALLKLFFQDEFLKLLQGDHSYTLHLKKTYGHEMASHG
jgi:hypothetical protein